MDERTETDELLTNSRRIFLQIMAALFGLRLQTAEPCSLFHEFASAQPVKQGVLHFVSVFFYFFIIDKFMNIIPHTSLFGVSRISDLLAWAKYFTAV